MSQCAVVYSFPLPLVPDFPWFCPLQTSGYCCWETRVGQELYRLFWLDFFLEVAEVVVLDLGRAFVVRFRLLCKLSDWVSYVHVTV